MQCGTMRRHQSGTKESVLILCPSVAEQLLTFNFRTSRSTALVLMNSRLFVKLADLCQKSVQQQMLVSMALVLGSLVCTK